MSQDDNALPVIGMIGKLKLMRGDALVIKSEGALSQQQCERMRVEVDHFLGTIGLSLSVVPVLILDHGLDLQVMDARELYGLKIQRLSGEVKGHAQST